MPSIFLADGKKILAKRLVASSIDPSTLVLKPIGEVLHVRTKYQYKYNIR
ncbi:MAG TPA: hypothetical protein VEL11_05380 [Candidatus Bathyarchaeia archaeon]|nr:hypothetical protein [Candidatus Bathyarchaeia archaeon]